MCKKPIIILLAQWLKLVRKFENNNNSRRYKMYNRNYYNRSSMYSTRIKDNDHDVVVEYPVPGFEKKDLNLTVKENYLLLKGKTDDLSFEDTFRLGNKIDQENIDAKVVNGVLVIKLPKITPDTKEISIN
jgi:HSP20 family molecular chaperone IbpA